MALKIKDFKKISIIITILMRLFKTISKYNKIRIFIIRINKYKIEIILSLLDVHQKDSK
jgi:hypothetical protein